MNTERFSEFRRNGNYQWESAEYSDYSVADRWSYIHRSLNELAAMTGVARELECARTLIFSACMEKMVDPNVMQFRIKVRRREATPLEAELAAPSTDEENTNEASPAVRAVESLFPPDEDGGAAQEEEGPGIEIRIDRIIRRPTEDASNQPSDDREIFCVRYMGDEVIIACPNSRLIGTLDDLPDMLNQCSESQRFNAGMIEFINHIKDEYYVPGIRIIIPTCDWPVKAAPDADQHDDCG